MNPITDSPAEESVASVDPVAAAIADELAFQRGQHRTLTQRSDAAQAQIDHLEQLLELRQAGPVIPVSDPQDEPTEIRRARSWGDGSHDDDPEPPVEPPTETEPEPTVEPPKTEKRKSADVIRPVALQLRDDEGTFTSKELGQVLDDAGSPFSPPPISKCLSKMVEAGELVQVSRGGPGVSAVWGDPETNDAAPDPSPRKKLATGGPVDVKIHLDGERVRREVEDQVTITQAPPVELGGDTHTARNGEDIDDVILKEIQEEAPVAYHEIAQATGESGVLIKAALGRLKAKGHIAEGDDGLYRITLADRTPPAESDTVNEDLRKRIRAVLKAHNGASARKLSGLLRGVTDPEIADELHRMQDEDLVNYYGLTRQWKLIED